MLVKKLDINLNKREKHVHKKIFPFFCFVRINKENL